MAAQDNPSAHAHGAALGNEISRRPFFKLAAAGSIAAMASPWIAKGALASSGSLNILSWSDETPAKLIEAFTKKTGIKVIATPFSQVEELMNKLQATQGEGFDLCTPSYNRAGEFRDLELLAPIDTARVKLDVLIPAMLGASQRLWTWDGKLYHLPHCWGSEAIAWRTDLTTLSYNTLSYGTLWDPQYKGKVQGRPHSMLLGLGLWMDASGKLPSNRMLDSYKDEAAMRRIYDEIVKFAIAHKSQIKQFWDSGDTTKSGFMENGCVIGQTWDGPIMNLKNAGKPMNFVAPQEGAIGWIDGVSLLKAAKNTDQAYEWINFIHTPEGSALMAESSGYNPVVKGAEAFLSAQAKRNFSEAYPGDALEKLWIRPLEPGWYAQIRNSYAEQFKTA